MSLREVDATETEFDIGDIVYLKSGSGPMTTVALGDTEVRVNWFNIAELRCETFPKKALTLISDSAIIAKSA